jgi:serine/threonine-protein phosphatase 2B catalytic subunit
MLATTTTNKGSLEKKVPKIDFTLFTAADGTVVSTKERVIRGKHENKHVLLINTNKSKDVPAPAVHLPTEDEFWSKEKPGLPDIHFLKDHFYREGRLTETQALFILEKGKEILRLEKNLLDIPAPVTGR